MGDDHPDGEAYRETIAKMGASLQKRGTREEEVETELGVSMPGLLRRLMDEHNGRKRPALADLNDRLDEVGMETNVSNRTFYAWLEKYRLG
jgi:hypothetical protein